MTRERDDAIAAVERWAALWSARESVSTETVFAPDVYDHRPAPGQDLKGIDAEMEFVRWVRSAFPDLQIEIEDTLVEGDRVAARVRHQGTHLGDFMGIAATGRTVVYEGTVIFRLQDDRIAERWGTVDLFGILWQLGDLTSVAMAGGALPSHQTSRSPTLP